jgi:hypothetical protein
MPCQWMTCVSRLWQRLLITLFTNNNKHLTWLCNPISFPPSSLLFFPSLSSSTNFHPFSNISTLPCNHISHSLNVCLQQTLHTGRFSFDTRSHPLLSRLWPFLFFALERACSLLVYGELGFCWDTLLICKYPKTPSHLRTWSDCCSIANLITRSIGPTSWKFLVHSPSSRIYQLGAKVFSFTKAPWISRRTPWIWIGRSVHHRHHIRPLSMTVTLLSGMVRRTF